MYFKGYIYYYSLDSLTRSLNIKLILALVSSKEGLKLPLKLISKYNL